MLGRSCLSLSPTLRPKNLCFALFVLSVLIFTIIATTYHPNDLLLYPSTKLTSFLTSTSNTTFRSNESVLHTGEDFIIVPNSTAFINLTDIASISNFVSSNPQTTAASPNCEANAPIDCTDHDVSLLMMQAAVENFPDIHFYRFGKSIRGADDGGSCDIAWRFRPKDAKRTGLYKDYRRFHISQFVDCSYSIIKIGDYHSGVNARKNKKKKKQRAGGGEGGESELKTPMVQLAPITIPVVESEETFSSGRYLIYSGGGDRCKSMNHYLWSFLCALGEARFLNRTLIMDLSICLSSIYTSMDLDEEGKDFRFYFDFEHLRDSASVLDQSQFWRDWEDWQKKDRLSLHLVEDFRVTPMMLADVDDVLIMRKFGSVEPDNYWHRVCEGETESVIQRPWHLIWKSRRLIAIVSGIASRLNWDFDSVHFVRGEKARNTELRHNLAADTLPEAILSTLRENIDDGRHLYVMTNEPNTAFFNPLKDRYSSHFLDDYKDLWDENSEWYAETKELNNGIPVDFDGYMRVEVDTEVFLRGKKRIETFNNLINGCKDGITTCRTASDLMMDSYGAQSSSFGFSNKCTYPVWVGILSGAGTTPLALTGFKLETGKFRSLDAPTAWSGRFWGRTICSFDSTGKFLCATGDCATGKVECSGSGAIPPATLVEVTLGSNINKDFYDISLVDGYNVPISMTPRAGECNSTSCPRDVNIICPKELQVIGSDGKTVACKSACDAFGDPKYCCTGAYGSPKTCKPTVYSKVFKSACPLAYSYAYDDASSTFTCIGADYLITFCP